MRDAQAFFHNDAAPDTASNAVDGRSTQPGVGCSCNLSATYGGGTGTNVTCTLSTSDTEDGAYANIAVYNIPDAIITAGGVILSTPLPSTCHRYLKTTWAGLTGGLLTDGLDFGLRDGLPAAQPYNV